MKFTAYIYVLIHTVKLTELIHTVYYKSFPEKIIGGLSIYALFLSHFIN